MAALGFVNIDEGSDRSELFEDFGVGGAGFVLVQQREGQTLTVFGIRK